MDIKVSDKLLGDDTEADLTWLATSGDRVTAGQPIAELETAKAAAELEAECDGTLEIVVPSGEAVEPGQTIGRIV